MAHKGIAMLLVGLLVVGMFSAVLSVPVGTVEAAGSVPCPGSPGKITSGKESHLLGSDSPRPLNPCPGFEWAKTFGTAGLNDQAWGLDITSDGGAVVLIRTQSQGVTVVKVDGEGAVQWQKRYTLPGGGSGPGGIQQTSDGGFVLANSGNLGNPVTGGIVVYRLDAVGDLLWQAGFDGPALDGVFSIAQTPDGGYIVGGQTESFGAGSQDLWVLRLDPTGGLVWQKRYGGPETNLARGVLPTPDGGFVAGGYGGGLAYVIKMDSSGNVVWQKGYRANLVALSSIQPTLDGGYIFTGKVGAKWTVVKLTSAGGIAWQKTFGDAQWFGSITQTSDGGYVASMNVDDPSRGLEFALLRLDSNGKRIWQRSYGGPFEEQVCYPYCLQEAPDGNIVVAGWTASFGTGGGSDSHTNADAWVLRVFSDGTISSTCDPGFGMSLRSPGVQSSKIKVEGLSFTSSASSIAPQGPGATANPGTLVTSTQCAA